MFEGPITVAPSLAGDMHVSSIRPLQHLRWRRLPAVRGGGAMLVGPHESGVQALVPPGVLLRTAEGRGDAYSCTGWRQGVWGLDDLDMSLIDARRPIRTRPLRLVDVLRIAPREHRPWIDKVVRRQMLGLIGAAQADAAASTRNSAAHEWLSRLFEEVEEAFGSDAYFALVGRAGAALDGDGAPRYRGIIDRVLRRAPQHAELVDLDAQSRADDDPADPDRWHIALGR